MKRESGETGAGIVVLSPCLDLLHMNKRAYELLAQLAGHTSPDPGPDPSLTAPLDRLGQDLIEAMQERLASNNWDQFHHYRTIGDSTRTILLKGFGLPDRRGLPHSKIVMLLSPHVPLSMPRPDGIDSSDVRHKNVYLGGDAPRAADR